MSVLFHYNQIDIEDAFFHRLLAKEVYTEQPIGSVAHTESELVHQLHHSHTTIDWNMRRKKEGEERKEEKRLTLKTHGDHIGGHTGKATKSPSCSLFLNSSKNYLIFTTSWI